MRGLTLSLTLALALAGGVAHADPLTEVTLVARGGYLAPRFAPDGGALAVSGPGLRGLYLVDLASGVARRVSDEERAGVHARFLADGRLAFRVRRAGADRDVAIDRDGREVAVAIAAVAAAADRRLAEVRDDRLYVATPTGGVRQVGAGDRFFAPRPSPDGRRIAVEGLATGIWIFDRASERFVHVGRGTSPAWSPDGSALVFERTEDDGHVLVASDLLVYRVADGAIRRLTATDDRIERRPSFSPDGRRVAFDDDQGAVFVATLTGGAP